MQYPLISESVKASQDAGDNLDMSTKATNAELNEAIPDEFGVKYSKDGRMLLDARRVQGVYYIKDRTKIICDEAFSYCDSLSEIVIPSSVTSIGDSAFEYCKSLKSLVIPDGVTSIGEFAFSSCESLTDIVLPDSVTSIGFCAFWGCSSLCSVVIPDGVTSIGEFAFYGCKNLWHR